MKTDLGPLGIFDFLTKDELEESLNTGIGHKLDIAIRDWYRGVDSARFPRMLATATTVGALDLGVGPGEGTCGPSQGDVWMVRRVIVKASQLTDPATYVLYRGTSPSDPSAYSSFNVLDAFTAKGGGLPVNVGYYPSTKSVLLQPGEQIYTQILTPTVGVTYLLEGEAIRVPAEMKGKVLS
jgi:hypothetical protein